jgi:hypothetical protein
LDNTGIACAYFRLDSTSTLSVADQRDHALGGILDHLQAEGLHCGNLVHQGILEGVAVADPDFLFIGDALDATYASLLTGIRAGWVDEFRVAEDLWAHEDLAGANSMLASINPVCPQDAYRQYGLDRYWDRFDEVLTIANLRPWSPFSSSEYSQLETLASLDVSTGGYGTMQARALTDWMPSSDSHNQSQVKDQPSSLHDDLDIRVYPNPATSTLMIDGLNTKLETWEIVDASGRFKSTMGSLTNERLTLQIGNLDPGVYAVILRFNGSRKAIKHTFVKLP